MLDVGKLATLAAIVEHGSFSAAARALHLTQPAVSRQVAVLERRLGTPLLRRGRGGAQPTDAGRVLLEHTAAVLDRLGLAEAQVHALTGSRGGTVRLGSFFTALVHLSAEVAARLDERHPDVLIVDDLVDRGTALAKLRRGELDLAIVFDHDFEPEPVPEGLRLEPLFDDPVRILLPTTHAKADGLAIDLADLEADTWIRARDGSAARLTDHVLTRHSLAPPLLLAGYGDEPVETQALVAAGRGVTLTHDLTVIVSRHQLVVLPVAGETTTRHIAVARAHGPLTPAAAAVLHALHEIGEHHQRRLHPGGPGG